MLFFQHRTQLLVDYQSIQTYNCMSGKNLQLKMFQLSKYFNDNKDVECTLAYIHSWNQKQKSLTQNLLTYNLDDAPLSDILIVKLHFPILLDLRISSHYQNFAHYADSSRPKTYVFISAALSYSSPNGFVVSLNAREERSTTACIYQVFYRALFSWN